MQPFRKLTDEELEKAWQTMSMHNSELLLMIASLEKQNNESEDRIRTLKWRIEVLEDDLYLAETSKSITKILAARITHFFKRFK